MQPPGKRPMGDLEERIIARIHAEGPLSFDVFMQAALYDPEAGFYAGKAGGVRTGEGGDFVTAPMLTPVFASAFARFVHKAWVRLGEPKDWLLVEPGGATGELLAGVLQRLEELDAEAIRGIRVVLVDASPAHREQAKKALGKRLRSARVEVTDVLPVFDAPAVVIANELLDNLPVRLLVRQDGAWWERMVDVEEDVEENGRLGFRLVEAPAPLVAWVQAFDLEVPDRHQLEVPVGAEDWLRGLSANAGKHAVVLALVDYGETARDLFGEPRPWGTVLAYEGQQSDREVLLRPGKRDVTVHVNWSAVGRSAREAGWDVVAFTHQFAFLSAFGALDEAVRLAQDEGTVDAIGRLSALKEVLLPGGMGEAVKVLVLARGLKDDGDWLGLQNMRELEPRARG